MILPPRVICDGPFATTGLSTGDGISSWIAKAVTVKLNKKITLNNTAKYFFIS
jgi:hypothetical protein